MGGAWQEYERSKARSNRAGALFAVAGVAAFAWLIYQHFFARGADMAASPPVQAPVTGVVQGEIVEFPAVQQEAEPAARNVAPGERAYAADGTTYVGIYECTVNGQRVVSDRPCGAGATARVLEVAPARASPPSVPEYRPSRPATGTTPVRSAAGSASAGPDNTAACEAVDRAIDNLNSRMRQRYGSAEGERLRAQWHALKQERYDLRCGR